MTTKNATRRVRRLKLVRDRWGDAIHEAVVAVFGEGRDVPRITREVTEHLLGCPGGVDRIDETEIAAALEAVRDDDGQAPGDSPADVYRAMHPGRADQERGRREEALAGSGLRMASGMYELAREIESEARRKARAERKALAPGKPANDVEPLTPRC